ncbi:uncharacterized protein LOC129349460 [Amphiprion ocellaris]|uniref:uncharacterized protein LOC129349460 n=1 Tax=Amphiprion ocellaris TaxID=80972 RepID=UPI002410BC88|nr:uncharacterized protein LOC129349460 [Amphiprion ocellaris]
MQTKKKEQHHAQHDQKEQTRVPDRPACAPRETGPLLQVRLHALVSYLAKKNKNVLLLSTFHARDADTIGRRRRADNKPAVVQDYNSNKGGVDNLDKVVGAYSCRRMMAHWPFAVFHNILGVSSYNAFVIWRELNLDWLPGRRNKRRVVLEQLGKALVAPLIERRARLPSAEAAVVKAHRLVATGGVGRDGGGGGGGSLLLLFLLLPLLSVLGRILSRHRPPRRRLSLLLRPRPGPPGTSWRTLASSTTVVPKALSDIYS